MPTVLPSQIVDAIDDMFGPSRNEQDVLLVRHTHAAEAHTLLVMLDQVPSELIDLSPTDYREFSRCRGVLTQALPGWALGSIQPARQVGGKDVVACIRRLMRQCRDEAPSPEPELPFILEDDVRLGLEDRIQAAWVDFKSREWMGATVLAGHALEALLLWAVSNGASTAALAKAPDKLALHELIIEAAKLRLITAETQRQADLARDARNLIHPGKATRSGTQFSKATALTALAAVYRVVEDMKTSFLRANAMQRLHPDLN